MLEWVAYHLSIGFDHILIATNDCDDGSDELAKALQELRLVTHLENSGKFNQEIGEKQTAPDLAGRRRLR